MYTILNKNGKKDEITTVTALYEVVVETKNDDNEEAEKSKNEFLKVVYASTENLISDGLKFINFYQIFWASHAALVQGFNDVYYGDQEKGTFRWFVGIGVISMISLILFVVLLALMYAVR